MDRKGFIGSSDIASIMGMSRWKTPLMLWSEKTGEIEPKDLSDVEAVEMGNELEETVARLFTKRTGLKVRRAPKIYESEVGLFKAQVDRLVEGTDELLECKTCSAWKAKEWEGEEIPQEYILQVLWQLMVTGRNVGHIAVLIGGQCFKYKKIEADQEMFDRMREVALSFWQMVLDKTPPRATGLDNEFIVDLYPQHNEQVQAVEELNDTIGLLQQVKGTIADAEAQKDELEAKIKAVIGEQLGVKTSQYVVTWKRQPSVRLDTKVFKAEKPEIFNQYAVKSETRILRVKGAKNGDASNN